MAPYDGQRFTPPAPVARVTLRHSPLGKTIPDVPMLIDSGADITLIPQGSVDSLGISRLADTYELMGFDGTKSVAHTAELDLLFLNRAFKGRYLLVDSEWGILGRDVLNHLALLLDGPNRNWKEHNSAISSQGG